MREILFEGKRTDNNEWIRGNLVHTQKRGLDYYEIFTLDGTQSATVKTETVREFTGLTDKNGNKIFEGDIVKEWSNHWKTPFKLEVNIYAVVCKNLGSLQLIRKTEWGETSTLLFQKSIVEIIGNIYDNPELIEKLK